MAKHVIILGAGASKTSGYPLANELRLQLSSRVHFAEALDAAHLAHFRSSAPTNQTALNFFNRHADAVKAFRTGGFATVDEFCKLMSKQQRPELSLLVNGMRQMTRFVLGVSNPENAFQDSDYYLFIQRIFRDDLFSLRDDLTVLTFNYDPYLDFLLLRALRTRAEIRTKSKDIHPLLRDAVTSGFLSKDLDWLKAPGFKLLKLHGTIAGPDEGTTYNDFFATDPVARLDKLINVSDSVGPPPIVFPWEVFSEDGILWADPKAFPLQNHAEHFELFKGLWASAQAEITVADKISFVGLSAHPFFQQALSFLFKHKPHRPDVIIANRDNPETDLGIDSYPLHSPARKIARMLKDVAPKLFKVTGIPDFVGFRAHVSFRDFIERDMDPIP